MDADAVEFVDGLLDVRIGILNEAGGGGEHGAIERKARFDSGLRAQLRESWWNPFQNHRAGIGNGRGVCGKGV